MKLYTKITIGLVAGIVVGWLLNSWYDAEPFEKADMDTSGFVTMAELLKSDGLDKYKNSTVIARADQNRDGKLDWREIQGYDQKKHREDVEVGFENADLDKNGELSRFEAISKGGAFEKYGDALRFARTDTSGNGGLTQSKFKKI